jgi:hypothetical protein
MSIKFYLFILHIILFLLFCGCESQSRCETFAQKADAGGNYIPNDGSIEGCVIDEKKACQNHANSTVYFCKGNNNENTRSCEVAHEKPIIECRPPKVTPKASICPPRL